MAAPTSGEAAPARARHGYLFGRQLTHSLSPLLHQVVYDHLGLPWAQTRLESDDMGLFLELAQHPDFYGASVTMPNKVAVLAHLDEQTDECRATGACNTVFVREQPGGDGGGTGRRRRRLLCGANTDVVGIRDAFLRTAAVADPRALCRGRPGLVVGGGGAARAAVYALRRHLGADGDIYLVNRDADELAALVRDCAARGFGARLRPVAAPRAAAALPRPAAAVVAVPDRPPRAPAERRARRVVEALLRGGAGGVVLDMCYNPSPFTALAALAERCGWHVILGTEALVWQGLEQDRYWTGRPLAELPVDKVREAVAAQVAQRARL